MGMAVCKISPHRNRNRNRNRRYFVSEASFSKTPANRSSARLGFGMFRAEPRTVDTEQLQPKVCACACSQPHSLIPPASVDIFRCFMFILTTHFDAFWGNREGMGARRDAFCAS
jgi:hypothetical protein